MSEFEDCHPCNYLPDQRARMKYLLAQDQVPPTLMDTILENGWRKFGSFFFRPICPECQKCIPLRIPVDEFFPTKKQRALIRKNLDIRVKFAPLQFCDEIYQIYIDHCSRFPEHGINPKDQFINDFFKPACDGIQSMYYIHEKLIAVGFLDVSAQGLSSVYFIYKSEFNKRRLGTFSILQEIAYTQQLGLKFYYLGYFIAECSRMAYKNHFHPNEKLNWKNMQWENEAKY